MCQAGGFLIEVNLDGVALIKFCYGDEFNKTFTKLKVFLFLPRQSTELLQSM